MKHYFTLLILLAAVSLNATEHPIAEWDFSGGNINSRCGRYTTELRGATRIMGDSGSQYLSVGRGPLEMPQGIALSKNARNFPRRHSGWRRLSGCAKKPEATRS